MDATSRLMLVVSWMTTTKPTIDINRMTAVNTQGSRRLLNGFEAKLRLLLTTESSPGRRWWAYAKNTGGTKHSQTAGLRNQPPDNSTCEPGRGCRNRWSLSVPNGFSSDSINVPGNPSTCEASGDAPIILSSLVNRSSYWHQGSD